MEHSSGSFTFCSGSQIAKLSESDRERDEMILECWRRGFYLSPSTAAERAAVEGKIPREQMMSSSSVDLFFFLSLSKLSNVKLCCFFPTLHVRPLFTAGNGVFSQ